MSETNGEIQPADARLRVRFLIAMTALALAGALGILYLDSHLRELQGLAADAQPLAAEKTLRAGRVVFAVVAACAAALALYLGWTSWRVLRSRRFPPPGARVISNTRVRHGPPARRLGAAGLAMAALTLVLTAFIVGRMNLILETLLDSRLKPTRYNPIEEPR